MPSESVLRRKAQKKKKRRRYSRCSKCGGWCLKYIGMRNGLCHLAVNEVAKECRDCGQVEILVWSGGGNGRRIPGGESSLGKG